MAVNQAVHTVPFVAATKPMIFAGDGVLLAGQIDYPDTPMPAGGYPVVFVLHHAGCNTRECYNTYAEAALEAGYAVFRWDKRGTGRSGAGGRGSTTQDAVNAYQVMFDQANINPNRAVMIAQGAGTGLLGSSYGLFARVQHPYAVLLIANVLDENAIVAIDSRLKIIMSEQDWNSPEEYAQAACFAHNRIYKNGADYYVARGADRNLNEVRDGVFHAGARKVMFDWLKSLHPASKLV